jgi:transcriptional regulator with XRE-family HTH domain
MSTLTLNERRRRLGIPIRQLVKLSRVPVATVNRILSDPSKVRFEHVSAVAQVLGVDMLAARRIPVKKLLQQRAAEKATYVARLVQGTQGLEGASVDAAGFDRLIEVATAALLAGNKRKLWNDE